MTSPRPTHLSSPNVAAMSSAMSERVPPATTKYPRVRAQSSRSAAQLAADSDLAALADIDLDDDELLDFDEDDNTNNNNNNNNNNDGNAISPRTHKRTSAAKSFLNALTGRGKPKNASKGTEKKAPTRSERMGAARTSFTFAADEHDDDVALFGPDASAHHKSKKWFAWLARLNPIGPVSPHAPAAAATSAAPNPRTALPRAAAPAIHVEADADAASGTRLAATSIEELPHEVRTYLNKCGLTDSNIRQHFWMVMAIVQFVGKIRVDNPWKDEQKKKTGNPGRDFRGATDGLARAANPETFYKLYQSAPLGSGGFGTVFRGQRRSDTLPVAIKTMPNLTSKQKRENLWEVGLLRQAQHPNVVALYEAFEWSGAIWLVMERLDGGSLAHAVVLSGGFREPHVAYTSERVLVALEFMHKHDIVHRDLKSANLMFTTQGDVKIIDFGLCRDVSRAPGNSMLGSPFWMSPEMVRYEPHSTPTDIWSFAISLLEMINGHPPNHTCAVLALFKTATVGVDLSQWTFSAPLTDFLHLCLQFEPAKRATATELRKHAFLEKACDKSDMQNLIRQIFLQENAATSSTAAATTVKK